VRARAGDVDDRADRERRVLRDRAFLRDDRRASELALVETLNRTSDMNSGAPCGTYPPMPIATSNDGARSSGGSDDPRAIESREDARAPVVGDHRGHRSVGNRIDPWRLVQWEGVDLSNCPAGLPDHLRDHTPRPQQIEQAYEREECEHRRDEQDHVYADRQARHDLRAIATNRAERHQGEDRGRDEDAQRVLHDGIPREARDEPWRVLARAELDHDDADRYDQPGEGDHAAGFRRQDRPRGVRVELQR
jgi:hypothetical protein